jgi:hypothetical protein
LKNNAVWTIRGYDELVEGEPYLEKTALGDSFDGAGPGDDLWRLLRLYRHSGPDNETYVLQHFHAPGEHRFDGASFAIELYLVHKDSRGEL